MITVAGLFADVSHARQALLDLFTGGVPHEDIGIAAAAAGDATDWARGLGMPISASDDSSGHTLRVPDVGNIVTAGTLATRMHSGEAASLADFSSALQLYGLNADQAQTFIGGLRGGSTLIVVQAEDVRANIIQGVFRHNHVQDGILYANNGATVARLDSLPDPRFTPAGASGRLAAEADEFDDEEHPVSTSIAALTSGMVPGSAGAAADVLKQTDEPPAGNDRA